MTLREYGKEHKETILLLHGGGRSRWNYREAAKLLHKAIPGSQKEILHGLRHGDLSINFPERYAQILTDWIGEAL